MTSTDLSKRLREVHGLHAFAELLGFSWEDGSDWDWHDVACAMADTIAATIGAGTCHYYPDDAGFTWWDENDVEHYEDDSASDECDSASCDKCGFPMMVGEEGWFDGWDEITEWTEEDGSEHKGYVLKPRFKFCPKCGARVVSE